MNAKTVYDVAKALPMGEQKELFDMLQKELGNSFSNINRMRHVNLTKKEAYQYLLNNVFNLNSEIKR